MKLEEIRTADLDGFKKAIIFLSDNMHEMTYGEFIAFRRTIEIKGESLGINYEKMNEMAEHYQIFGEI